MEKKLSSAETVNAGQAELTIIIFFFLIKAQKLILV